MINGQTRSWGDDQQRSGCWFYLESQMVTSVDEQSQMAGTLNVECLVCE